MGKIDIDLFGKCEMEKLDIVLFGSVCEMGKIDIDFFGECL